jgi:CheY-like chemotaxis protein
MKGDREKYIVAGMDDYVAKPINTTLLSEALIKATGMASDFQSRQAVAPAANRTISPQTRKTFSTISTVSSKDKPAPRLYQAIARTSSFRPSSACRRRHSGPCI